MFEQQTVWLGESSHLMVESENNWWNGNKWNKILDWATQQFDGKVNNVAKWNIKSESHNWHIKHLFSALTQLKTNSLGLDCDFDE